MNKVIAYFKIARISNIPTVWSNCLVGFCYAAANNWNFAWLPMIMVTISLSLFYIAGMFLNDYFDSKIDAIERPHRPIPAGVLNPGIVLVLAISFLIVANLICLYVHHQNVQAEYFLSPFLLTLTIFIYNYWHKNNPISPFIMAACRFLAYIIAASCFVTVSNVYYVWAICLASHVVGLTYTAKQENLSKIKNTWPLLFLMAPLFFMLTQNALLIWVCVPLFWTIYCVFILHYKSDIRRCVCYMIAGIALIDAVSITMMTTSLILPGCALCCFGLTIFAHKYIPGT